MDELIGYLFYGLFLLVKYLFVNLIRGVRKVGAWVSPPSASRSQPASALSRPVAAAPTSRPPATTQRSARAVALERSLDDLIRRAEAEAERCESEEANERFADVLVHFIPDTARAAKKSLSGGTDNTFRQADWLAQLGFVFETTSEMAEQRRDPDKLLLLGDADALAEACYSPVVDFARGHGIRLRSERAATFLGDKDLAIFTGFIPTGLAPIILPSAWSTEIGWWPALAHEIGHDFHASVVGFDRELRTRFGLPENPALPSAGARITGDDLEAAYSSWLSELFADLFGTLMLGPAYVTTMAWSFAEPKDPRRVSVIQPVGSDEEWTGYEEHPPAHLRVVLACRLLAEIGFPGEASHLETEWRKKHQSPDTLYLPTRQKRWLALPEAPFIEYGDQLTTVIYEEGMKSLSGFALRSIPGLDLGPREHQAALDTRDAFLAGRRATTRDPRYIIAGAVLAWKERPALGARILRAARATVPSVGVSSRRLRVRAMQDGLSAGPLAEQALDPVVLREAVLLAEILSPRPGSFLAQHAVQKRSNPAVPGP